MYPDYVYLVLFAGSGTYMCTSIGLVKKHEVVAYPLISDRLSAIMMQPNIVCHINADILYILDPPLPNYIPTVQVEHAVFRFFKKSSTFRSASRQ